MLLSKIEAEVQKKLVGLETEYKKTMEKLEQYYGDTGKTQEVLEQFCKEAKLCFNVISTTVVKEKVTLQASMDDKEGALLQIIKIP